MDTPSYLDQNFEALRKEMHKLTDLRDKVVAREEPRMAGWLQIVRDKELEMGEMQEQLKKLEKAFFTNIKEKDKLNKRVIKSLTAVKVLIENKDEISKAMETFITEVATGKPQQFSEGQLKSYTSNFKTIIGSGEFGVVYKGELPNKVQVAIKVLHDSGMMDNIEKQFKAEVNTMSKTHHRNLAKLYGFCFGAKKKALVYEYVENGSLDKILSDNQSDIKWETLYWIAIGAAKGLSYLHHSCDERIIHRDIKPGNVLLTSEFYPKVTDFGLAKNYSTDRGNVTLSTGFKGIRSYDAPEVRYQMGNAKRKISLKADVFSFGMMLFDILRRDYCKSGSLFAQQIWEKFQKQQLEEVMTDCRIDEEKHKEVAMRFSIVALLCIEHTQGNRPTMSQVVNFLEGVVQPWKPRNPFLDYDSSHDSMMNFDSSGSGSHGLSSESNISFASTGSDSTHGSSSESNISFASTGSDSTHGSSSESNMHLGSTGSGNHGEPHITSSTIDRRGLLKSYPDNPWLSSEKTAPSRS